MKTLPPRLMILPVLVSFDAAAADVESGRRLFEQHCSECHGPGHPGTQRLGWTRGEARSQLERRTDLKAEYITAVVRIPDAKALAAGDLLFNEMHLWLGESARPARLAWAKSVDRLASLGATQVIAGHKKPGLADDASSITYTQHYLSAFEHAVASSRSSADLRAKIRAEFPGSLDMFDDFLLGNSSKVAMGETPPWQE